jgi:glutamate formiminotransferase/formiminotetrahydrofolate cyclodeaminase
MSGTKLVECVPNFSEGRDRSIIEAIANEIARTEGALLLDVDPGAATNRTVITFVGPPEAVEEAAFRAIQKAAELIDMRRHKGEHPRIGATDVCPFVPVEGATMEDCVAIARRLGRRVGEELGIPVYLYEAAATRPERRSLAEIRKGEYEGLPEKLRDPAWKPDFGPAEFNARSGATVIGAREFLIAYNVNLNTRDKKLAQIVAEAIREAGGPVRDERGRIVRDAAGKAVKKPGRFRECRAVGWFIEEYHRAQVSINLTNYKVSPLHAVFDACCEEAARLGLRVTGSEIVGLVPLAAILAAGDSYLSRQGKTSGVPEADRVEAAAVSLGLSDVKPFDPMAKIVEYRYRGAPKGLSARSLGSFADEVSRDSPAPGGGSVAATAGALAAALASMVAALAWARSEEDRVRQDSERIGRAAQRLKDRLLEAIDLDASAFQAVLSARRMPAGTPEAEAARGRAIEEATMRAARVPLEVLDSSVEALALARDCARLAPEGAVSDAGVAAAVALAAAEGASLNVRINLPALRDRNAARELDSRQRELLARARQLAEETREIVEGSLDSPPRRAGS